MQTLSAAQKVNPNLLSSHVTFPIHKIRNITKRINFKVSFNSSLSRSRSIPQKLFSPLCVLKLPAILFLNLQALAFAFYGLFFTLRLTYPIVACLYKFNVYALYVPSCNNSLAKSFIHSGFWFDASLRQNSANHWKSKPLVSLLLHPNLYL